MHTKGNYKFWIPVVAIGLIVFAASVGYFYQSDLRLAEEGLRKTANYMKVQCATYTHNNNGAETQALLRAVESCSQARDQIDAEYENGKDVDADFLATCAQKLWLQGILLLDPAGNVELSYAEDPQVEEALLASYDSGVSFFGLNAGERTHTQRIQFSDGGYVNMAATARKDGAGMVVSYYAITPECAREYSLTIQSLLEGYRASVDGTIIVTDEGRVVASNDSALLNQSVKENPVIQTLKNRGDSKHLTHIYGNRSYGLMLKQRDYYIYAYLSDKNIFATLPQNILVVMILYSCVIYVIWLLMQSSEREFQQMEAEKEMRYKKMLLESAKRADAANVAKTEFLQRMSHDIRTPINGICGMLDVAEYYASDLDKQAECRAKIKDASHLLLELVNEVLDMGKLESGEMVLEEQPFDLHEVLDEVLVVIEKLSTEQGLQLIQENYDVNHWHLIGSSRHVKRLLMNVMSNAVKYNKANGSITFSCRELPGEKKDEALIEMVCADTGIGMSRAYQERIFEPFTQENTEVQTKYGGSGLGMPIAKGLVDKMDGSLTFESEEGKGTTFVIRIPFKIDNTASTVKKSSDAEKLHSIQGYHILLAEDNALNMEIAEFLLETEGAIVTKAWNGEEAAETFASSAPGEFDAILMDVMMPKMDGYQATRTIRDMKREDAQSIPIVAMTANAFTEDRIKSREAGMNAHISKPLDTELVIKTVDRLVQIRRAMVYSKKTAAGD